jgi:hypothetical protein
MRLESYALTNLLLARRAPEHRRVGADAQPAPLFRSARCLRHWPLTVQRVGPQVADRSDEQSLGSCGRQGLGKLERLQLPHLAQAGRRPDIPMNRTVGRASVAMQCSLTLGPRQIASESQPSALNSARRRTPHRSGRRIEGETGRRAVTDHRLRNRRIRGGHNVLQQLVVGGLHRFTVAEQGGCNGQSGRSLDQGESGHRKKQQRG